MSERELIDWIRAHAPAGTSPPVVVGPGDDCAVLSARDSGKLAAERFDSYVKLLKELEHLEQKMGAEAGSNEKRRWKVIHKNVRNARKKDWIR